MIRKAENSEFLALEGSKNDLVRVKLVEGIIEVIAKESEVDKLRREVELLSEIHSCSRYDSEKPSKYVVRISSALERYINQTGIIDPKVSRQLATLMIQNANLTADTLTSIIFQLSNMYQN